MLDIDPHGHSQAAEKGHGQHAKECEESDCEPSDRSTLNSPLSDKKGLGLLSTTDLMLVGLYVAWETVNLLCISWAKDPVTQEAAYSSPTVVFAAESAKLAFSAMQLRKAGLGPGEIDLAENWKFALPALLYCINNNLFVFILRIMPGSVFQVSMSTYNSRRYLTYNPKHYLTMWDVWHTSSKSNLQN